MGPGCSNKSAGQIVKRDIYTHFIQWLASSGVVRKCARFFSSIVVQIFLLLLFIKKQVWCHECLPGETCDCKCVLLATYLNSYHISLLSVTHLEQLLWWVQVASFYLDQTKGPAPGAAKQSHVHSSANCRYLKYILINTYMYTSLIHKKHTFWVFCHKKNRLTW